MGILHALENALGRHAELSEYAPKVEAVVEDLAARVERLESFALASTPEQPAAVASNVGSPITEASPSAAVPVEQGEPGQV